MKERLKAYFTRDSIASGMIAVLLAELVAGSLIVLVIAVLGLNTVDHLRWLAGAALPGLLVVRAYAKHREALNATRGAICALAASFLIMMYLLLKTNLL